MTEERRPLTRPQRHARTRQSNSENVPGGNEHSHVYRHTFSHYVDGHGRGGIKSSFATFNLLGDPWPPRIVLQELILGEAILQRIADRVIDRLATSIKSYTAVSRAAWCGICAGAFTISGTCQLDSSFRVKRYRRAVL